MHANSALSPAELQSLWKTDARLFLAPWRERLPLVTLQELGLSRSNEATSAGLVLVRPASQGGMRSFPGLWVRPEAVGELSDIVRELRGKAQAAAQRAQVLASEKESRQEQALRHRTLQLLASACGIKPREVADLLDERALTCATQAVRQDRSPVGALAAFHQLKWRDTKPDASGTFHVEGHAVSLAAVPPAFLAFLRGDVTQCLGALRQELQRRMDVAKELCEPIWSQMPAWVSLKELQAWAAWRVDHPNETATLAQRVLAEHLKSAPVAVRFGRGEARLKPDTTKVCELLWADKALSRSNLLQALRSARQQVVCQELERRCEAFIAANPLTEKEKALEYGQAEWQAELRAVFEWAACGSPNWERLDRSAVEALGKRRASRDLVLQTRKVNAELPRQLKDFYPLARQAQRRITFICGPTNSGKTHDALQLLGRAESGIYLAPLRLLALEVYESLKERGLDISLVTGEYMEASSTAKHISATVEMLDVQRLVDVAVVDEVQMLDDPDRGTAWLQAVLGAPARHLVLLGSPAAQERVQLLADYLGEPLEIIQKERLNPLRTLSRPCQLGTCPPGTAFIVFSRRDALALANVLRTQHQKKVSVVYGALSPEVRREQARLFREGENDTLVATDAIGMGLNLPIRRIVFTTSSKWDGTAQVNLDPMLVHQIAGRAGRFGLHEEGEVGALTSGTLQFIEKKLSGPPRMPARKLGMGMGGQIAETVSRHTGSQELATILDFFASRLQFEPWAKCKVTPDQATLAAILDREQLAFHDKLRVLNCPSINGGEVHPGFFPMVRAVKQGVPAADTESWLAKDTVPHGLEPLENDVRGVTLYCWMHYRYPGLFPSIEAARAKLARLNTAINSALTQHQGGRTCNDCSKPLPWNHQFGICDDCYRDSRSSHFDYEDDFDFDYR